VTELGHHFYEYCLQILRDVEQAETLLDQSGEPSGLLRVAAPVILAEKQITRLVPEFLRRFPKIRLELMLSARTMNIVQEGFDLSIRLVRREDMDSSMRLLAENHRVFCAAPSYLEQAGEPKHPSELANHNCLVSAAGQNWGTWRVLIDDRIETVAISGQLASDNAAVLTDAAVQGCGIALLGTFTVGEALKEGRLVEILKDHVVQDSVIVAVVPSRTYVPPRVSVFIDYLIENFGTPPVWDRL
jgi:DNA-binding transcriptional LysR family regulator